MTLLGTKLVFKIYFYTYSSQEAGQRNRYSDWLRAGQSKDQKMSAGSVKNILFSTSSRPAPGPGAHPDSYTKDTKVEVVHAHLPEAAIAVI
jgi:hypothetical protein